MQLIRRIVGWGLAMMGAVAFAAAIWPAAAGVVTVLLVTVLCAGAGTLVVLGGRRVHTARAGRRKLGTMPAIDASTDKGRHRGPDAGWAAGVGVTSQGARRRR